MSKTADESMHPKKILHTIVGKGETLYTAGVRAGWEAGRNGFDGYVIDCGICGYPVHEHGLLKYSEEIRRGHAND